MYAKGSPCNRPFKFIITIINYYKLLKVGDLRCTSLGEGDFVFRDIIGVVRVVQGQGDQQILSMPVVKPMTNVIEDMVILDTVMKCLRGA